MFIELGENGGEREGYGNEGRERTPSTGLQNPSSKLMEEGCRKARLGVRGGNCEGKGCGRGWTAGKDPDPVRGMRRMEGDMQILITMKVFRKRKILSVETILSAYTHTNTHTYTGTITHEHTDYTNLNLHTCDSEGCSQCDGLPRWAAV